MVATLADLFTSIEEDATAWLTALRINISFRAIVNRVQSIFLVFWR